MNRAGSRTAAAVLFVFAAFLTYGTPTSAELASFAEITGHDAGDRITVHSEMVDYVRYLDGHSDRVSVVEQGKSWEGRPLMLAIVTSPENHARLDEIKGNAKRLFDPRLSSSEDAVAIAENQPAIVYMGGSIHGFELSGAEGVLKLLEHLATRDDEETRAVLENVVVLLDPMLNPDGRDAFARRNHESIGREAKSQRDDWSNDYNSWEGLQFRTGHYFFDTNRDWWAHTQNETRYRVPVIESWHPQVVVDLHEMSPDLEFFFDPPAEPYGAFFPDFAKDWYVRFGQAYAQAFDQAGFEYLTGELFNYLYPGYTDSWGTYQGAVGMLYEQGSTRGLALERADESVRSLKNALDQQYTAAWTAIRLAADQRRMLLTDYYNAQRAAVADGRQGTTRYLFGSSGDPLLVAELVNLLRRNGIEVGRLAADTGLTGVRDRLGKSVGDQTFAAGTFVVEAAQPHNRLVRVLLEPDVPLPKDFLLAARERIDRGESPRFYDITAWSLPLLFDVAGYGITDSRGLEAEPVTGKWERQVSLPEGNPRYAYLIDGSQAASISALIALKEEGYRAAVTMKPTRIAGQDMASGTVVLRVGQNDESLHQAVRNAARRFGVELLTVDTGLAEAGYPSLGSTKVMSVKTPKIALLSGDPIHGYSFGWAWYTLDQQYQIPVTVRRVRSLAGSPIHDYNVFILPNTISAEQLAQQLGEGGIQRLQQWVRDGGSLVAIGDSVDFVRKHLELSELRSWYEQQESDRGGEGQGGSEAPEPRRFVAPGAIVRVELDPEIWLTAGYSEDLPALVDSSRIFLEPEGPPNSGQRVVGRYGKGDYLLMSGYLWPESRERLSGAVFAYEERVGRGRVILFAEDLNFRGYWRGADRLFLNAVALSPSAP